MSQRSPQTDPFISTHSRRKTANLASLSTTKSPKWIYQQGVYLRTARHLQILVLVATEQLSSKMVAMELSDLLLLQHPEHHSLWHYP